MSIEVAGVTRFFGSTRAVWQMDMTAPSGTVTGLVGSNGAGKTTLLLMIAALVAPDAGSIRVSGLDPLTQPREVHQAVGWMPDAFGTWDSLTCPGIRSCCCSPQCLLNACSVHAAYVLGVQSAAGDVWWPLPCPPPDRAARPRRPQQEHGSTTP